MNPALGPYHVYHTHIYIYIKLLYMEYPHLYGKYPIMYIYIYAHVYRLSM